MANRVRVLSTQIVVRMDATLIERLKRDAASNGRTVAQTVRFRLDQATPA
jgi:predicted DNA-binding protein